MLHVDDIDGGSEYANRDAEDLGLDYVWEKAGSHPSHEVHYYKDGIKLFEANIITFDFSTTNGKEFERYISYHEDRISYDAAKREGVHRPFSSKWEPAVERDRSASPLILNEEDDDEEEEEEDTSSPEVVEYSRGVSEEAELVVYTDGACRGNPGPGGWAWAVAGADAHRRSGGEQDTTNNRMELTAVLDALRVLTQDRRGRIRIVSDSEYVVKCFHEGWWKRWKRNGWKTSKDELVKNRDIWEPLVDLAIQHNVEFEWVKGHSVDRMNDLVDSLAVNAIP